MFDKLWRFPESMMPSDTTALGTVTILPSRDDTCSHTPHSAYSLSHNEKHEREHPDIVSSVFLSDGQEDKAVESEPIIVYSQCTVSWFSVPWVSSRLPAVSSALAHNPREKHFLSSSLESSPQHELLTMRSTTRKRSSQNPMPLKTPGNI